MKVLVVDDSAVMRKMISNNLFEINGKIQVIEAADGNEAFAETENNQDLDLIFCDINMPNCNGMEYLKKAIAEGVKAPIIMVSTESEQCNMAEAMNSGASYYITKPFNDEEFQHIVKEFIKAKNIQVD